MILKIFNILFYIAPDRIAKNGSESKYLPAINNPAIITIAVIIVLNLKKVEKVSLLALAISHRNPYIKVNNKKPNIIIFIYNEDTYT